MNFKLAILAAAAIGAATTAQAADLAKKAPAAANYVKVCDAMGAGFFYIPGSDTCLKISGYVRADYYAYGNNNSWNNGVGVAYGGHRAQHQISTLARGHIEFDARTATEYGLLRSFIAIETTNVSIAGNSTNLDKAFIQFGGLTAGRAQSMFDFFTGSTVGVYEPAHSDVTVNLLAYTFAFGNGVSATIGIEDTSAGRYTRGATQTIGAYTGPYYGGVKTPDVVANLKVEQAWGKAQLSAALHDDYGAFNATAGAKSSLGWAIMGGVEVKLGAADVVDLQAAYSKGAVAYVFPSLYSTAYDFEYAATSGSLVQAAAWAVAGSWTHTWTKTISTQLEASYGKYDADTKARSADFTQLDLIAGVTWAPVAGLKFVVEGEYRAVDYTGAGIKDPNGFLGVLRVQRDF